MAAEEVGAKQAIVWGLEAAPQAPSVLEEERAKHEERARKFGIDYIDPAKTRKEMFFEAKKERLSRPGFVTGFDPFSEVRYYGRSATSISIQRWGSPRW